jgi:hypothetical protein
MKLTQLLNEANPSAKVLKDPRATKMLAIAMRHDSTLPHNLVAALGPRPTDHDMVKAWSDLIDKTLRDNNYGDLSADGRFDDWLTRMYMNGLADYEDISGEGGDALGIWYALNRRGMLKPHDQDFNKFKTIHQLDRLRKDRDYRSILEKIRDAERLEKMKRTRLETVLVDTDQYLVIAPYNYGACYTFAHAGGFVPNFCTSGSSGPHWVERYAPEGMIVSIVDKYNIDSNEGKWQFHAATNQLVNGTQDRRHDLARNDQHFSQLFPGLMRMIVQGIKLKSDEIRKKSQAIARPNGYDIEKEITAIKRKFPLAYASRSSDDTQEDEDVNLIPERAWRVTRISDGQHAIVMGRTIEDVQQSLLARRPELNLDAFDIRLDDNP